jgi:hypothetical protein
MSAFDFRSLTSDLWPPPSGLISFAREVLAPWSWICYFTGQHFSFSECQRLTLSFTGQLFSVSAFSV